MTNIPSFYADDDTVYHYTSTEIALLHILASGKLRLNKRSFSIDPIENEIKYYPDNFWCGGEGINNLATEDAAWELRKKASVISKNTKQLSFCMNDDNYKEQKHILERYGFIKPRMWDQYGDKYKGVCLAFSRKSIENQLRDTEMHYDKVSYISYNEFRQIDYARINLNGIKDCVHYCRNYIDNMKKSYFRKHSDYCNEKEYRICSFDENEYAYIDISDSLLGIIVSDAGLNSHLYETLKNTANYGREIDIQIITFGANLNIKCYTK